jgi:hypothetical protein
MVLSPHSWERKSRLSLGGGKAARGATGYSTAFGICSSHIIVLSRSRIPVSTFTVSITPGPGNALSASGPDPANAASFSGGWWTVMPRNR